MSANTVFATTDNYNKGGVEIIGREEPSHYLFSNMYEVAANAEPWQRTVVAKNLEFTIETIRAEGESPWYICSHDETALIVQGGLSVHLIKPDDQSLVPAEDTEGSIELGGEPAGKPMGHIKAGLGHLALLPAGAAYQFRAPGLSVILLQSVVGDLSIEKWAQICQR